MAAVAVAAGAGVRAAQPESQSVTLECTTEMRALGLGTTQPTPIRGAPSGTATTPASTPSDLPLARDYGPEQ